MAHDNSLMSPIYRSVLPISISDLQISLTLAVDISINNYIERTNGGGIGGDWEAAVASFCGQHLLSADIIKTSRMIDY